MERSNNRSTKNRRPEVGRANRSECMSMAHANQNRNRVIAIGGRPPGKVSVALAASVNWIDTGPTLLLTSTGFLYGPVMVCPLPICNQVLLKLCGVVIGFCVTYHTGRPSVSYM